MKRLKLLPLVLLLVACYGSEVDWPDEMELVTNIPVVANVQNTFSYVVVADQMDEELLTQLNFDTTALVLSITLVNKSKGSFAVEIYENDSTVGYQRTLNTSMVVSEFPRFNPSEIRLIMQDFTGSVELALTTEN